MNPPSTHERIADELRWPEALATVTACKYETGGGLALAFGLPTSKHFRISYNYFANGALHTGEFTSAKPVPQGQLFPVRYNPEAPQQNSHAVPAPAVYRSAVLTVGVIGSLILSLAWLAVVRGCH